MLRISHPTKMSGARCWPFVRSYLPYAERYVVLNAGWYGLLRFFSILFKKRKIKEVYESWVERIYILVHFNLVRVRQSWGWDFMFPGWWPLGHDLLADFSWKPALFLRREVKSYLLIPFIWEMMSNFPSFNEIHAWWDSWTKDSSP